MKLNRERKNTAEAAYNVCVCVHAHGGKKSRKAIWTCIYSTCSNVPLLTCNVFKVVSSAKAWQSQINYSDPPNSIFMFTGVKNASFWKVLCAIQFTSINGFTISCFSQCDLYGFCLKPAVNYCTAYVWLWGVRVGGELFIFQPSGERYYTMTSHGCLSLSFFLELWKREKVTL